MKKTKKHLIHLSVLVLSLLLPLLAYTQNNGQNPDPFDDVPPDFEPAAPIDDYIIYLFVIALLVAFYFLALKQKKNSYDEI